MKNGLPAARRGQTGRRRPAGVGRRAGWQGSVPCPRRLPERAPRDEPETKCGPLSDQESGPQLFIIAEKAFLKSLFGEVCKFFMLTIICENDVHESCKFCEILCGENIDFCAVRNYSQNNYIFWFASAAMRTFRRPGERNGTKGPWVGNAGSLPGPRQVRRTADANGEMQESKRGAVCTSPHVNLFHA